MPNTKRKLRKNARRRKGIHLKPSPAMLSILTALGVVVLLTASGFTFAATKEGHDAFCASCHTQPESTFYQRSQDAQPVDLASFHTAKQTRCIDCHSGEGVTGRVSAELLGAHNALAFYTHTAVQPAKLTQPFGESNCLKCHHNIFNLQNFNNHFHVFLGRWQAVDPNAATCTSCHGGHATDGNAQVMYVNETSTRQVCQDCHQALGRGEEGR